MRKGMALAGGRTIRLGSVKMMRRGLGEHLRTIAVRCCLADVVYFRFGSHVRCRLTTTYFEDPEIY